MSTSSQRYTAIDWVRGIVMVLMALDHVRYFFSGAPFPPESLQHTTLPLFFTRWVTHFCAPSFFFLAGMSAYLRGRRDPNLSSYLVQRGMMLIALELTIVGFAWCFRPGYSFAGVIWALGWSMIILAAMSWLPAICSGAIGIAIVGGHHVLERIDSPNVAWHLLYVPGPLRSWSVLYPLIPWCGVMMLGYAAGKWFELDRQQRDVLFAATGSFAVGLFILLRVSNVYGNPVHFEFQGSWDRTLISLLSTEKYPPSLQYLLMTLGPMLIALAAFDRREGVAPPSAPARVILLFGRQPLFYYLCHLYLIHLLALVVAHVTGQSADWLGWYGAPNRPRGYGYNLGVVYVMWMVTIAVLYPVCAWYERLKQRTRHPILHYV